MDYFDRWPVESIVQLLSLYTSSIEENALAARQDPKIDELLTLIRELREANERDKLWALRYVISLIIDDDDES